MAEIKIFFFNALFLSITCPCLALTTCPSWIWSWIVRPWIVRPVLIWVKPPHPTPGPSRLLFLQPKFHVSETKWLSIFVDSCLWEKWNVWKVGVLLFNFEAPKGEHPFVVVRMGVRKKFMLQHWKTEPKRTLSIFQS